MALDFNKYAAKGNEVLNLLADELEVPKDKAGRILRAVLHATRNHLSIQESMQVIAQLPMALKGVYVDQWNVSSAPPRIHHVHEFLNEVRSCDKELAAYDLGNDETAARTVKKVFKTLNYYLTDGEFEDIIALMPVEIKELIRSGLDLDKKVL